MRLKKVYIYNFYGVEQDILLLFMHQSMLGPRGVGEGRPREG